MAELKALLQAYLRGQGTYEQLSECLDRQLGRSPADAGDYRRLLLAARKAGLSQDVFAALNGQISEILARTPNDYPDTVVLDGPLAMPSPAPPPEDPDITALAAGREDPTQEAAPVDETGLPQAGDTFAPGDSTLFPGSEAVRGAGVTETGATHGGPSAPAPAEDETAINATAGGPSEPTTAPPPDGGDATELHAGPVDDDATEMRAGNDDSRSGRPPGGEWPARGAGITREFRENDKLRGRFELISKLGEGGMGAVWKGRDLLKVEAHDRNPFVAIKLLQGDFKEHPEAFIALQRETAKQQRLAHPNIATVFDFDRDDSTQTVFMTMEVLEGQPLDAFIRLLPKDGLPEGKAMPLIEQLCAGLAYAHGHGLVHSDLKPGNCFLTKDGSLKLLDFGIARASKIKTDVEGEATLFDPGKLGALTPNYATVEMFEAQAPDPRDDIYALAIIAYQFFTGRHPYGRKSAPKALELGLEPPPVDKLDKRQNRGLARALAFHREDRTPSVEEFLHDVQRRKNRVPIYVGAGVAASVLIAALAAGPITEYSHSGRRDEIAMVCERGGVTSLRECLAAISAWDAPEQQRRLLADERVKGAVVAHIARGDRVSIGEGLEVIAGFDPGWQQDIRDATPAREAIVDLYESRIDAVFAPDDRRYDHAGALALFEELDLLYPDSAQVLTIGNAIEADRQTELSALSDRYNAYLADGRLVADHEADDISDVLEVIRLLDPGHRLLGDERLKFRFAELAEEAIAAGDYGGADALLRASAGHVPDDPALAELRFEVRTQLERMTNERRVAAIELRLEGELDTLDSLEGFAALRDDLIVLSDLSPSSTVLGAVRQRLTTALERELDGHIEAGRWETGEQVLAAFAKLLEIPDLTAHRAALSSAETAAGFEMAHTPVRDRAVAERAAAVRALLADPALTAEWEGRLKVPYKELIALLAPGDPALEPIRDATAELYLGHARAAREAERFSEALAYVEKGQLFYPELERFDAERALLGKARAAQREQRQEQARMARIEGLKQDFRTKADNDELPEAGALLEQLEGEQLPAGDAFLDRDAPALLAGAYLRRARKEADKDNFLEALTLAEAGLATAPSAPGVLEAVDTYRARVAERENELELRRVFDGTEALDVVAVGARLVTLEQATPDRFAALREGFATSRGRQLVAMAGGANPPVRALARRLEEYRAFFPQAHETVSRQVVSAVERSLTRMPARNVTELENLGAAMAAFDQLDPDRQRALTRALAERTAHHIEDVVAARSRGEAHRLVLAARAAFGDGQPALERLAHLRPPPAKLVAANESIARGELSAARAGLDEARTRDPDHRDLAAALRRLEAGEKEARERYEAYREQVRQSKATRDQKAFDREYKAIKSLWRDNPELVRLVVRRAVKGKCAEELAGYGARRGGTCYDLIDKRKGPEMVVVPAGSGIGEPFAIGKYELTVDDFNLFCKQTGSCEQRARNSRRLPITGISIADAERYARWLSEQATVQTGMRVVYRLPTVAEWEHAARAGGTQPEKKFNCRVTAGNNEIIAGHALIDARSGKANGWGLMNYVGNAQEWVRAGSAVVARGGAFADPLAKCELSISRSHAGSADSTTGFRLVRELG